MSDEPIQEPAPFLPYVKQITVERIVSHMNGVGAGIINSYPMAEVQSWTIQRGEAEAVVALGEAAVLQLTIAQATAAAPFLVSVCAAHHGAPEEAAELAAQLWDKALSVKANADLWAALSAYVNGLRARAADRIEAAADIAEVYTIESEIQTELAAFRAAYTGV